MVGPRRFPRDLMKVTSEKAPAVLMLVLVCTTQLKEQQRNLAGLFSQSRLCMSVLG